MQSNEYTEIGFFRVLKYALKHGKEIKKEAVWHNSWVRRIIRMSFELWVFEKTWHAQRPGNEETFYISKMSSREWYNNNQ